MAVQLGQIVLGRVVVGGRRPRVVDQRQALREDVRMAVDDRRVGLALSVHLRPQARHRAPATSMLAPAT